MNRSTRFALARLLVIPAILLLISPVTSDAGEETGVIEGVVTDEEGIPIPGVKVTFNSDVLDGERYAITDQEGRYRIDNLPPDPNYRLIFNIGGFLPVIQTDLPVEADLIAQANAEMVPGGPSDEIWIYDPPPLIPGGSSMITEVFTSRFLDTLPNGRSWLDAVSMVAGVAGLEEPYRRGSDTLFMDEVDDTGFHVHGADATDNVYLVDGTETTNAASGRSGMALPWEAIEEVEVLTGGLPAEYGRAVGGVVNVVTRFGGNELHGSLPVYYTDQGLQQDQDEDRGAIAQDDYRELEWGGSLGGPIVRDHLWFFAAYNKFTRTIDGRNYEGDTIERDVDFQEGLANLAWQVNQNNKLKAQYAHSPAEQDYDDSPSEDVPALLETGDRLWSLAWTSILNPDLFLETRVARHNAYTTLGPKYADYDDPRIIDEQNGEGRIVSGNVASIYDLDLPRTQYRADLNWYVGDWAGDHAFKFGAEYQDLEYEEGLIYPDVYTIHRRNTSVDYLVQRSDVTYLDTGSILTLFAQDDWTWREDWTFNLGLRWEQQEQENDVGQQVYKFDNLFSPRLGVSWDVLGNGRSRLFAHYGRYHDAVGLQLASFLNRQVSVTRYFYGNYETGDWTEVAPTVDPENPNTVDDSLDPNYKDEIVLGYEFKFLGDFAASARIIANRQNNMIEDVLSNEEEIRQGYSDIYIYHITNVESARRNYRGLELSLKKQLSSNYQLLAVYTLSESKGSVVYNDTYAKGLSTYADIAETTSNRYGNLPWDDEHYFKVNGSYHLPLGFIVGTSLNWRSGRPYDLRTSISPYSAGYISGYTNQLYLDPRGSDRMGSSWWLDVRLRKDFEVGPTALTITADAFNLTNSQYVTSSNEIYYHDIGHPDPGEANGWMRAGYFVIGGRLSF